MTLRRTYTRHLMIVEVLDAAGDVVRSYACRADDWPQWLLCQRLARECLR